MVEKIFAEAVMAEVQKKMPDAIIMINDVVKNNGIKLTGISIREDGAIVSPNIYLEEMESLGVIKAAEDIIKIYKENKFENPQLLEISNWQIMKNKVMARLENKKWNLERLRDVPHKEILDLVITFYFEMEINSRKGIVTVKNNLVKTWNVNMKELMSYALINTYETNSFIVKPMQSMLSDLSGIDFSKANDDEIYVCTNKKMIYGAIVMFYDEPMEKLSEILGGDFIILPSSIHEFVAIAIDSCMKEMAMMITEINKMEVRRDEWLSDHPYVYRTKTGKIEIG